MCDAHRVSQDLHRSTKKCKATRNCVTANQNSFFLTALYQWCKYYLRKCHYSTTKSLSVRKSKVRDWNAPRWQHRTYFSKIKLPLATLHGVLNYPLILKLNFFPSQVLKYTFRPLLTMNYALGPARSWCIILHQKNSPLMWRDNVRLKIVLVEICIAFKNKYTVDNNIQVNNVVCPEDLKSFSWDKTL